MKRLIFLLCLLPACSSANFDISGLGVDETGSDDASPDAVEPDTASPVDAVAESDGDASVDAKMEADTFVDAAPDTGVKDAVPETASDTFVADTADAVVDAIDAADAADAKKDPCVGMGFSSIQVGVVFSSPVADRPAGYLAFAGSTDGGAWHDPFGSCTTSDPNATMLICNFGTPSKVNFVVGVMVGASGYPLDTSKPFTSASGSFYAKGKYLACMGETTIGTYEAGVGFTGKLAQWGSTDKFQLIP